jgi:hypothetical protein
MIAYIAIGFVQGLLHEMMRQAVITHKRLFWWDVKGRIGAYFLYIAIAALIFLAPFYFIFQTESAFTWEEFVWPWIGGLALGIVISRIFVKKK